MTDQPTQVRQVRLLIADTDQANQLLTDLQLGDLLALEGHVKLAAAAALDVIATSEVLVSKVIRTQDLATDGAKVAAALHAQAEAFRAQVAESGDLDDDASFAVVEFRPACGPELTDW
jgi:hypothetical protein